MSLVSLCREDPLVNLVHDLFGANIVRVPDARVQPLSVVVHRAGRSFFRGSLLPLLTDAQPLGVQPVETELTDISGRRSRRVALDLGVHILRGFLKGFGLPTAELSTTLSGAAYLAFSFPAVRRTALDVNALGWALAGRRIERANPAAAIFFEEPRYELLLIDSVLTSSHITVVLSGAKGQRVNVDVDALRQIVADMGGRVGATNDNNVELTLESKAELTFAFSCVRLFFDEQGAVTALPPDHERRTLAPRDLAEGALERRSPEHILLSPRPALLLLERELAPQPW
jgi:hypothetical protein